MAVCKVQSKGQEMLHTRISILASSMPRHLRGPSPNGMNPLGSFFTGAPLSSSQRSGLNLSASAANSGMSSPARFTISCTVHPCTGSVTFEALNNHEQLDGHMLVSEDIQHCIAARELHHPSPAHCVHSSENIPVFVIIRMSDCLSPHATGENDIIAG